MRAGLYLRISKDSTRDEAGIERQEKACRNLVANLGWDVANVYVDNDTSATKTRPRPAYRRMLDDINAGEIDAIVAWQPDRLYRHPRDLEELVPIIEALRIPVQTVNAGHVDLSTSTGRMVARILGAVALQEVELKAERWLLSYEQARVDYARPFNGGWRTYGYTKNNEIVEDEAKVVRAMAADLQRGQSVSEIARSLNHRGVVTSRGGPWRPSTVRNLLRNPRLAGHVTMRGVVVRREAFPGILTAAEHDVVVGILGRPLAGRP